MSQSRGLVIAPLLVFLASCLPEDHCAGGGFGPVTGSRAQFTTAPGELPGCTLLEPTSCAGGGDLISLLGHGSRRFFFGPRDGGCGGYVQIDDWSQADPVVRLVAMKIAAWDLGQSFGVLVQGITIACPM